MFEAGHAEADGPGKLQEYGVLNKEKKINLCFMFPRKDILHGLLFPSRF